MAAPARDCRVVRLETRTGSGPRLRSRSSAEPDRGERSAVTCICFGSDRATGRARASAEDPLPPMGRVRARSGNIACTACMIGGCPRLVSSAAGTLEEKRKNQPSHSLRPRHAASDPFAGVLHSAARRWLSPARRSAAATPGATRGTRPGPHCLRHRRPRCGAISFRGRVPQ